MDDDPKPKTPSAHNVQKPFAVRLPGLVLDQDIGLGDAVKRLTTYAGIRPCGGCERRATVLNRWVQFTGRRSG